MRVFTLLPHVSAGKSTFATDLEDLDWVRVNQDDLGSSAACKEAMLKSLRAGKNTVLDRCNTNRKERRMFITEMRREVEIPIVEAVWLNPGVEVCRQRVIDRRNHPTLDGSNVDEVLQFFLGRFDEPEDFEGFSRIQRLATPQDVKESLADFKARFPRAQKLGASSTGKPPLNKKKK